MVRKKVWSYENKILGKKEPIIKETKLERQPWVFIKLKTEGVVRCLNEFLKLHVYIKAEIFMNIKQQKLIAISLPCLRH